MNDPDHDLLIRVDEQVKGLKQSTRDDREQLEKKIDEAARRLQRGFVLAVSVVTALAAVGYIVVAIFHPH